MFVNWISYFKEDGVGFLHNELCNRGPCYILEKIHDTEDKREESVKKMNQIKVREKNMILPVCLLLQLRWDLKTPLQVTLMGHINHLDNS